MTRVKICGLTREGDVDAAVEAGADAIGFVLAASPRRIDIARTVDLARRLPPFVQSVGVFLDQPLDEIQDCVQRAELQVVQLHGNETPEFCAAVGRPVLKRLSVPSGATPERLAEAATRYGQVSGLLLDPGAGDGKTFDWKLARIPGVPIVVAGGLKPDNVAAAVRTARPAGVDVSSGVEERPGIKNVNAMRAFVRAVREADAAVEA